MASRRGPAAADSEEVTGRDAATRLLRRHSTNFPIGKTLASWPEDSTIPDPTQTP
ncbi:hypothetical protein ACIP2Y_44960 [Streptomyces sviceus]|uniref:hypothetical protein n=1 Tax=Streptomyces sviceus TaxID=285530 RepID=UPI0037F41E8E